MTDTTALALADEIKTAYYREWCGGGWDAFEAGYRAALRARQDAPGWRPIETAPKDDALILAGCPADEEFPEGRVMIWKGSILSRNLSDPTPRHLQFPATHWMPIPASPQPPATPRESEEDWSSQHGLGWRKIAEGKYVCTVSVRPPRARAAPEPARPAPEPEAGVEELAKALKAVRRWAEKRCPCENDNPDPCPLCGERVDGGRCKAVPATFPRDLLAKIDAALAAARKGGTP